MPGLPSELGLRRNQTVIPHRASTYRVKPCSRLAVFNVILISLLSCVASIDHVAETALLKAYAAQSLRVALGEPKSYSPTTAYSFRP